MSNVVLSLWVRYEVLKAAAASQRAERGQGVIEYAGALVIATVLVATVLTVGPGAISGLFTNIVTTVQSFFSGKLAALS